MKKNGKPVSKHDAIRELFKELKEGMAALADARRGNRVLTTHSVEIQAAARTTTNEPPSQ